MSSGDAEELTKVFVELSMEDYPDGPLAESFWAKPLGDDLYEVRNVPFYAYDLHFGDVVRALPDSPDQKPRIHAVLRRSGHKTLRVWFPENASKEEQQGLLGRIQSFEAYYERATRRLVAVDVEPSGDYDAVFDQLWDWEEEGLLTYETGAT